MRATHSISRAQDKDYTIERTLCGVVLLLFESAGPRHPESRAALSRRLLHVQWCRGSNSPLTTRMRQGLSQESKVRASPIGGLLKDKRAHCRHTARNRLSHRKHFMGRGPPLEDSTRHHPRSGESCGWRSPLIFLPPRVRFALVTGATGPGKKVRKMACSKKPRQVRTGKKPGPKAVAVHQHKRSKPGKC